MKSLALARLAYKLVCFKQDVEDIRSIEADYKAALLEAYIDWVRVLAKALQKVTDKGERKAIIKASIKKIHSALSKLGKEYLTEAFEVGTGRERTRKKQEGWEPNEEELQDLLDEAIADNDRVLAESLMVALYETAGIIFGEPEEFETQTSIREQLMSRAFQVGLYASAAWVLYWHGYVESKSPEVIYIWDGMEDRDTCEGCRPRIGEEYTKDTLPGRPGDGSTPCGPGCRCWLETKEET